MKNTIIGTAGHVDHGKTSLIKALTGDNTDRLKEEQKRGITIELGFSHLNMPDGEAVGIIDVPGHEKFIKNMLAGAGGIDIALLVIAADEGIMPQTREHIEILSLLGIKEGIVALTKVDMVDEDWKELVMLDIEEELSGTFLENAPIMPVSAYTGEGVEELRTLLFEKIAELEPKNMTVPFRIPVDRVFSVDGFGTVITGTLIEGQLSVNDDIMIYPSGIETKARSVQVHGLDVPTAYAGQRVAVNLASVSKTDIEKGDTLAEPHSMEKTFMIDVRMDMLKDTERTVLNGSRVHLYHGAKDTVARVVLLDEEQLMAGESGYAQLRLNEELATKAGDRFVIRFYSPMETIGGGVILDANPIKHKRNDKDVIARCEIKEKGSLKDRIEVTVLENSRFFPTKTNIKEVFSREKPEFDSELAKLLDEKKVIDAGKNVLVHIDFVKDLGRRAGIILSQYHSENPLHSGMKKEEFRTKLLGDTNQQVVDNIIKVLCEEGFIKEIDGKIASSDFEVVLSDSHKDIADKVEKIYLDGKFAPADKDEISKEFPKDRTAFNQVFESLVSDGKIVRFSSQIAIHKDYYDEGLSKLKDFVSKNGKITLAEFRDLIGTTRKYAIAFLEYLDLKKITKMVDDARIVL